MDGGICSQGCRDLVQLIGDAERQVDEDPFPPCEFTRAASTAAQPLVANSVSQPLGNRQRVFEQLYRVHRSLSNR